MPTANSAEASGARIVHTCGFDCIPSDLGVLYVQRAMQERHGTYAKQVKLRVLDFQGRLQRRHHRQHDRD